MLWRAPYVVGPTSWGGLYETYVERFSPPRPPARRSYASESATYKRIVQSVSGS
ncbi:hypothetical protein D1AOALGA4SA_8617 [Olavius algarvensis Delta 1 endosymbiont]|nr:hypothetical protein D1AOALGA4SA_8617 [Olavius algarvensis Delta 1 endosymbiont]